MRIGGRSSNEEKLLYRARMCVPLQYIRIFPSEVQCNQFKVASDENVQFRMTLAELLGRIVLLPHYATSNTICRVVQ